jgi:hypothetical protein
MYVMAALLVIGFICNLMVKAVSARYHMKSDQDAERAQMAVGIAAKPAGA